MSVNRGSTVSVVAYFVIEALADLRVHTEIIDHPDRQKYNISKVKHLFQINRYCKLQNMQYHIIGCWQRDFDKILFTNSNDKSLIWICWWTRWVTCWQPPNPEELGVYHRIIPELSVQAYQQPEPLIWHRFDLDPDLDPKWRSWTIANIHHGLTPMHRALSIDDARPKIVDGVLMLIIKR